LDGDPVVDVECHAEGEHILDELLLQLICGCSSTGDFWDRKGETYVHGGKCLTGLLTMAIDNVCNDTGGAKLDSEVDQAHAYNNCFEG